MACFVYGDGTAFFFGSDFSFLFQAAYNAVHRIQEVLLFYKLLSMTGSNQGCFVAHIGNVGAGKTGSLAGQQFHIHRIVYLDRTQVHTEYFFALVHVR